MLDPAAGSSPPRPGRPSVTGAARQSVTGAGRASTSGTGMLQPGAEPTAAGRGVDGWLGSGRSHGGWLAMDRKGPQQQVGGWLAMDRKGPQQQVGGWLAMDRWGLPPPHSPSPLQCSHQALPLYHALTTKPSGMPSPPSPLACPPPIPLACSPPSPLACPHHQTFWHAHHQTLCHAHHQTLWHALTKPSGMPVHDGLTTSALLACPPHLPSLPASPPSCLPPHLHCLPLHLLDCPSTLSLPAPPPPFPASPSLRPSPGPACLPGLAPPSPGLAWQAWSFHHPSFRKKKRLLSSRPSDT